jgi:hypothetical protein
MNRGDGSARATPSDMSGAPLPADSSRARDDDALLSDMLAEDGVEQVADKPLPASRRRSARSEGDPAGQRPRSRALPQETPLAPVALWVDPNPPLYTEKEPWRWTPAVAGLAMVAWLVALGLLFTGDSSLANRVDSPRATLAVAWALAAALTFLPIQIRLGLPGLAWQGLLGWTMLGYVLAYVPPPTGWLLDLPDLPVYLLLFVALFFATAAASLPLTFLAGRHLYQRRMHRLDLRRARRQAYEIGVLVVTLAVLAGLRVLSFMTGALLIAIVVLVETLLLSQVAPEA